MTIHRLKTLQLKNFRCFTTAEFDLEGDIILLQGPNGCGKTSILEALYYGTCLRSFRTRLPKELASFGTDCFFIKMVTSEHEMAIGVSGTKRQVKLNQKSITSYEALRDFQTVLSVTEDDVAIVRGSPEERRFFLDSALLLLDKGLHGLFKDYRVVLSNRNALLQKPMVSDDELSIWTQKLWTLSGIIQAKRIELLAKLSSTGKQFIAEHFGNSCTLEFEYQPKHMLNLISWHEFSVFWKTTLLNQEKQYKRSLFGAHTDDLLILFNGQSARFYASRGQQKLIVMLIKMAQVYLLRTDPLCNNAGVTFLIDDFMTDFDEKIMEKIITTGQSLKTQLIFTSPAKSSVDEILLLRYGARLVRIAD